MKYLLSFCLGLCLLSSFWAQTNSKTLDTITVVGKRIQESISESSQSYVVIDQKYIQHSSAQSVAELLQSISGIDVRRRGINGIQADVSIRGGSFDQALILLNDIPLSDPQTGHHSMNIPVDLSQIERIEILKGPAARQYGQNAYAGCINIITKNPKENKGSIEISGSTFNTGKIGFQMGLMKEKSSHLLSYQKSFSEGYRHNTDYQLDQFFYQNYLKLGKRDLQFQAGHSQRSFGANGFYASPLFTEQFEQIETTNISASYPITYQKWHLKPSMYFRRNQDEYIFVRNNPSIYRNLHIGNTYGVDLSGTYYLKNFISAIGIEGKIDDFQSNNLGTQLRKTLGIHLEEKISMANGKFHITPGISYFYYSDFKGQFFPGVNMGVKLSKSWQFFTNSGYTWRIPTYTDLFYSDPANEGNSSLKPEKAVTTEFGLKYNQDLIRGNISAFTRQSTNLIDWTKIDSLDPWKPQNVASVHVSGIEAALEINPNNPIQTTQLWPYFQLGYTYMTSSVQAPSYISRYSLDLLKHQVSGSLVIPVWKYFWISGTYKYTNRVTLDDYSIVDAKVNTRFKNHHISAFVNNLTNTSYTETSLVPMPGRWMGLQYQIIF